jgi:hypothetical protein
MPTVRPPSFLKSKNLQTPTQQLLRYHRGTMPYWKNVVRTAGALGFFALLCPQSFALPRTASTQTFPTLTAALDAISSKYKVHLGLEYAPDDKDNSTITLDLSSVTIEPVLNRLTAPKTSYTWSLKDGVYDVYPKSNSHSILDVMIRTFSIDKVTPEQASRAISDLPEVKEWLATQRVVRREYQVGSTKSNTQSRISLTVTGVTLRSVLNLLNQELETPEWIVVRFGDKLEYVSIQI